MRTMLCALALLGLGMAAAPAAAQNQDHHAAMMAEHHRELGVTPAQAERLQAIHASLAETMRTHCEQVRAAGGPNAQTHASMHGQMTQAMEAAHRQAMAVLTPAQRAKADSIHAAHHGAGGHGSHHGAAAGHDRSAGHAAHGAAKASADHAGHGSAQGSAGHAAHGSADTAKRHAEHGCAAPAATSTPRPRG